MIYRVMSVCWKACGARLLSSQGQRRGGKNTTENSYLLLFWRETPLLCVSSPGGCFWSRASRQRLTLLLSVAAELSTGWGTLGAPQSAAHSWTGTSLLEGASCHMFPESFLGYCCITGLSLDQAGFSTGYPKNICLILEDEPPTGQKNRLAPGFSFFFTGCGVGWGGWVGGSQACKLNKREVMGCLDSGPGQKPPLANYIRYWAALLFTGFLEFRMLNIHSQGSATVHKFQHSAQIFSTVAWKFLITSANQREKHQQPNLKMGRR